MTKAEKIFISLAVMSLVISIASPITGYYWLDPSLKAFKDRARLQLTSGYTKAYNLQLMRELAPDQRPEGIGNKPLLTLRILNVGNLPAKEIQVVLQHMGIDSSSPLSSFVFDPPVQYEVKNEKQQSFIVIKRPLPAHEEIKMALLSTPELVTVSNEYGETSVFDSGIRELPLEVRSVIPEDKNNKGINKR